MAPLVLAGMVVAGGCGRESGGDEGGRVDLNAISEADQLEAFVGKRVTLIGRAGLSQNSRFATLEGREGGGVVVFTDVEKMWPEAMAPRLVEVTGELEIERAAQERQFSLRRSQLVRWAEAEQVAEAGGVVTR